MRIRRYRGAGVLLACTGRDGVDRVLLGKRTIRPFEGRWTVPGGEREGRDGMGREGDLRAAVRELGEELGGYRPIRDRFPEWSFDERASWALTLPFFRFRVFLCRIDEVPAGWPVMNHEFSEVEWFPVDSLPPPLHIGMRECVRSFLRRGLLRRRA